MKESLIEFFRPNTKKIAIALAFPIILPLLLIIGSLFLFLISGSTFSEIINLIQEFFQNFFDLFSSLTLTTLIGLYIFEILIFYPISCSLTSFYVLYKEGKIRRVKENKVTFLLIFLGLTMLNPITLWFGYQFTQTLEWGYHPSRMVEIMEIKSYSPFNTGDFKEGDIIYRILIIPHKKAESRKERVFLIKNSSDFFQALNEAHVNDSINIDTYRGRTGISKTENITDWGITVRDIELK